MLILAALAQLLRLSRWGGHRALRDPLVLILHLGYSWVPIGLLLLGLSVAGIDIPRSAGIHALTAGAMTTMILAVISRASLGHTGRDLRASPLTIASYGCVTIGALVRVVASLGVGPYRLMLDVAGAIWGGALLLFLIVYWPILRSLASARRRRRRIHAKLKLIESRSPRPRPGRTSCRSQLSQKISSPGRGSTVTKSAVPRLHLSNVAARPSSAAAGDPRNGWRPIPPVLRHKACRK